MAAIGIQGSKRLEFYRVDTQQAAPDVRRQREMVKQHAPLYVMAHGPGQMAMQKSN
jgi:hypothetical protein